jgi:DNA repair exonuclease SbcCD ATPase subunit
LKLQEEIKNLITFNKSLEDDMKQQKQSLFSSYEDKVQNLLQENNSLKENLHKLEDNQLMKNGEEMSEVIMLRADLEAKNTILISLQKDFTDSQNVIYKLEENKKMLESQRKDLQSTVEGNLTKRLLFFFSFLFLLFPSFFSAFAVLLCSCRLLLLLLHLILFLFSLSLSRSP